MNEMTKITTIKDWETDQEVRWCPGCGDYAILKAVQRTMPELGVRPEDTVFISGIGCSSRFPYYMETYGFHTIHGRAPAVATGAKLANPDLDVWIITGDGDALSIGGNHTMHLLRRNLNCQIMLFNNEIYGLTKGQYSPTSRIGTRTPSTPLGSFDRPINPCSLALGANARFVARGFDVSKKLPEVLIAAHKHQGAAFIEIFQNCIVYNKDVFEDFTAPSSDVQGRLYAGGNVTLGSYSIGDQLSAKVMEQVADFFSQYRSRRRVPPPPRHQSNPPLPLPLLITQPQLRLPARAIRSLAVQVQRWVERPQIRVATAARGAPASCHGR